MMMANEDEIPTGRERLPAQEEEEFDVEVEEDEDMEAGSTHTNKNDQRPPNMRLTDEEENWAWDLVAQVEANGSSGLKLLSDMEYVQHGLVARGNIEEAMNRIRGMQYFRELYNIQDTVEECLYYLEEFIKIQPGVLINLEVLDQQQGGGGVGVWNQGALLPARAESERAFKIHIVAYYYMIVILHPNLQACREGILLLMEGMGMDWENFDISYDQRINQECVINYPMKCKELLVYNTNTIVNMTWSLLKPFLSQSHKRTLKLGCQLEFDDNPANPKLSLCDLHFLPSYEAAMQNLLVRAKALYEERHHNEETFRL